MHEPAFSTWARFGPINSPVRRAYNLLHCGVYEQMVPHGRRRTQRRLAAILAADVVGYSRLMQVDEAGTLAVLKVRRREILQPLVPKHHGRVVKVMGAVEFASAVNAVAASRAARSDETANADCRMTAGSFCVSE